MPRSAKGAKGKKRTATQAIQTDRADIAATQQEKGRRTKQYQKEVGSYRGATQMSINAVRGSNLGGLRGTPEGRDLQKEYAGRIKALKQSLPFTIAPVQREYKSDIQGINTDLAKSQLGLQQDQQDRLAAIAEIQSTRKYNRLEAAGKLPEQLAETAKNKAEKRAGVDLAYQEALRIIRRQQLDNANPDVKDEDKGAPIPQTEAEWMDFEDHLESTADIDRRAAKKAVKALKRRIANTQTPASGGAARSMESPFEKRFRYPLG